jgi:hypothetical protein
MRCRTQRRGTLYDLRHRNVEIDRHRGGGEHVRQVAAAQQRRLQLRISSRRAEMRGNSVQTALVDRRGGDVRFRVDPERADAPDEGLGAADDPRIVGIRDEEVRGACVLENLGFRCGDRVRRLEEPQMRVADVRPHADVGLRDGDQRANLSWMVHAQLDDCNLRPGPQLEERERQTDVIVEIPFVPEHPIPHTEKLRRHFLRGRLPGAAGDRDDLRAHALPNVMRDVLQRSRRVVDANHDRRSAAARSFGGIHRLVHDRAGDPPRHRRADERVAVEAFALDCDEELPRLYGARVDRDAPDDRGRIALHDPAAGGSGGLRRGERQRLHRYDTRDRVRRFASALAATATSSNGSTRSPTSWYFSCPLPATSTRSPGRAS